MPTIFGVLQDTMLFTSDLSPTRVTTSKDITVVSSPGTVPSPLPGPVQVIPMGEVEKNAVWSWKHVAAEPHQLTEIGCRVRNMNMNYKMVMPVCDSISVENIVIHTMDGKKFALPLTADFLVDKYRSTSGLIPDSSSGLWQLESRTDESLLVVFAYKTDESGVSPLPIATIEKLGKKFMPDEKEGLVETFVEETTKVFTCSLRVVVCIGFTFCKERPDFEPTESFGMFRLYPHVMVRASAPLASVEGDVVVKRAATSPHAGQVINDAYFDGSSGPIGTFNPLEPIDTMESKITHELMTDANGLPDVINPRTLPLWQMLFDYYDTDPLVSGAGFKSPVVVVNATKTSKRSSKDIKVQKLFTAVAGGLPKYHDVHIVKAPRQGEFDNLHMAPRMTMGPVLSGSDLKSDNIAMAPFCVHDCLHTHFRWGDLAAGKPQKGFNAQGVPYQEEMAPLVPPNQTVFLHLLKPAGYRYRFLAQGTLGGAIPAGSWTIGFHHGMAYAGDAWGTQGKAAIEAARIAVETAAMGETVLPGSRTAENSWSALYWRLRYGGIDKKILERLVVPDMKAVRSM